MYLDAISVFISPYYLKPSGRKRVHFPRTLDNDDKTSDLKIIVK